MSISKKIKGAVIFLLIADLFKKTEKSEAFKLGLVNKAGKEIKKPKTKAEKNAYGLYEKFLFKLKKAFGGLGGLMILLPLLLLSEEEYKNDEELQNLVNEIQENDDKMSNLWKGI